MVVHLVSPDNRYDTLYLANYARLRVKENWRRSMVSACRCSRRPIAMRIWLDPSESRAAT